MSAEDDSAIGNGRNARAQPPATSESAPLLAYTATHDEEDHMKDWDETPWYRTPSVFWLLPPFCLFAMAFGGVAVPRLNIIIDLFCQQYYAERNSAGGNFLLPMIGGDNNEQCQIPEIHSRVSTFMLALGLVAGLIGAFTSPRLGSLSDRYGRRRLIAFSSFGLFANEITTILAVKYPQYIDVNFLFIGAVFDGLCGSFMLGLALAFSYSADCTSSKHRAMAFGAFQGCLFLGVAIGPALGGLLVEATGNILSIFYVTLVAHFIFIVYILTILPESLSKRRMLEARKKHTAKLLNDGEGKHWSSPKHLFQPLGILFPTGPGTTTRLRLNLILLAIIDCTIFGVGAGGMTVIIMYAERQFHWRNFESSMYLSAVNSTRVTMLFLVLPVLITYFRRTPTKNHNGSDYLDVVLIRFAIIVEAIGYFFYAIAPTGVLFTLAGALAALGGVGSPTIQSTLTKHIPRDKTGQLLGAMALLHSLTRVVAPTIFNLVYAATVGTVPQTVFLCLGGAFAGALVCSWFIKTGLHWEEPEEEDEVVEPDILFV